MSEHNKFPNRIREVSPCKDCPERFLACSDRCPKDERGEYGYQAWRAEVKRVEENRKAYLNLKRRKKWWG